VVWRYAGREAMTKIVDAAVSVNTSILKLASATDATIEAAREMRRAIDSHAAQVAAIEHHITELETQREKLGDVVERVRTLERGNGG
jgi:ferritin-like metal-binding protein YciE